MFFYSLPKGTHNDNPDESHGHATNFFSNGSRWPFLPPFQVWSYFETCNLFLNKRYVSPRFNTPFYGAWITGVSAAVLALALDIELLADMVSIGTLFAF